MKWVLPLKTTPWSCLLGNKMAERCLTRTITLRPETKSSRFGLSGGPIISTKDTYDTCETRIWMGQIITQEQSTRRTISYDDVRRTRQLKGLRATVCRLRRVGNDETHQMCDVTVANRWGITPTAQNAPTTSRAQTKTRNLAVQQARQHPQAGWASTH